MKIIDCFTFYNELELLFLRFSILYDHVDYFVLVESPTTHAGHAKQLYYADNKHIYEKFQDKIIHIITDLPHKSPEINYANNENWVNENFQRNYIKHALQSKLELVNEDLIIVSDLDEIIHPDRLVEFRNGSLLLYKGFSLKQDLYYYNLHCKNTWYWSKAKIMTYEYLLQKNAEDIRQEDLPLLENCGWHLSYFGNAAFIKNKLKEFVHQEYNYPEYTDETNIQERIKNCVDLFGRDIVQMRYVSISENSNLPPLYDTYLLQYTQNYITTPDLPVYMYYHVCCIENWKQIMSRMIFKIKHSGLYDLLSGIRCTVLGNADFLSDPIFQDPKIIIRFHSEDLSLYERPCLNNMIDDSQTEEFYALYCHSKGVKHHNSPDTYKNVYDWCEYLFYFNIYQYNKCIQQLNTSSDTVGCNLQELGAPLHYSGNFWWAKSAHIAKLPKIVDTYYNTPEFLVTSIPGTYANLWTSGVNHYHDSYSFQQYEGKHIEVSTIVKP
jgi:beta-1,4-mannosyl-glycoprotein beta-1,4-N-acetylglucosaminyltransferase